MTIDPVTFPSVPFVGRSEELAAIARLLSEPTCRLLTLVGPGGIGKTRLATESAKRFSTDVRFVPLQPLTSSDLIVPTVADVLRFQFYPGADPKQQLLDFLYEKAWLLVLDNFEHLLGGSLLLSEILAYAPEIRLLVTSRERLNLVEEWALEVGGLGYPSGEDAEEPERFSAVQLFVQKARRVKTDFELTDKNRQSVVRVCRLVEGMPLGIELAASWVRVLSPAAIAEEIGRGLDILETPARNAEPRHRTMRAALDQSWRLLSDPERNVFMRLSVFRGGFTREAAEAVTGASLRTLTALVDKSLVRIDDSGRYWLHELMRQYGEEHLVVPGEQKALRDAHCAYFAEFVMSRVEDLKGRRQLEAIAEIAADFENVRTAWNWAATQKDEQLIGEMLDGVDLYCGLHSRDHEAQGLMRYAEQQLAAMGTSERLWGRLLMRCPPTESTDTELHTALQIVSRYNDLADMGYCYETLAVAAYTRRDYSTGNQLLEQSLVCYQQLGDRYFIAHVLFQLQSFAYERSWDDFLRFGEASLQTSRAIGDHVGAAWSLSAAAIDHDRSGRFAQSERLWLERIALGHAIGNLTLVANGYGHLCHKVYFFQGDFDRARTAAEAALHFDALSGHSQAKGWALATLGLLANMDEKYDEASQLCQQAVAEPGSAWMRDLAAWGLSIAACATGDYEAALEYLLAACKVLHTIHGAVGTAASAATAAIIWAHQDRSIPAIELLAFAFTHPLPGAVWLKKWPLISPLLSRLEQEVEPRTYSAAWERGRYLAPDDIAVELLRQLQEKRHPLQGSIAPLRKSLLSERELDVLKLVAEGFSNQEIADRLYIGVSTVKKHINHIYDKLNVKNRTQAVARARERALLV